MKVHFDRIKYRYFNEIFIEIAFLLSHRNKVLLYRVRKFEIKENLTFSKEWVDYNMSGEIVSIRTNEDFDQMIKLANNVYIKICFSGSNCTKERIIESFHIIDEHSKNFKVIEEDFQISEEEDVYGLYDDDIIGSN
ncbi:MAG: hypothetical protein IJ916_00555 [Paludibacteraceae bacterium]|nr:hypothetical protein [Paludibacteraceae bacterium]